MKKLLLLAALLLALTALPALASDAPPTPPTRIDGVVFQGGQPVPLGTQVCGTAGAVTACVLTNDKWVYVLGVKHYKGTFALLYLDGPQGTPVTFTVAGQPATLRYPSRVYLESGKRWAVKLEA